MELRHLRYFLAVVDTGSFTRAAAQCFVAQSALSQQIGRLEAEIGVALFRRTSRSVRLTEAGEALVPRATRILLGVDDAVAEMQSFAGMRKGTLRLGLIQAPSATIDMIEVMGDFHDRHPGIRFEVTDAASTEMVAAITGGELDVALVGLALGELPSGLRGHLIAEDPLVVVEAVSDDDPSSSAAVRLADVAERGQFIHFQRGSGLRSRVEAAFARAGVAASGSFAVGQVTDMIRLAERGVGVTIVPVSAAEAATSAGARIAVTAIDDPLALHPVVLAYDPLHSSFATAAFIDEVLLHRERQAPG
jgi:DNA-binding transcriptional LysR family regulator